MKRNFLKTLIATLVISIACTGVVFANNLYRNHAEVQFSMSNVQSIGVKLSDVSVSPNNPAWGADTWGQYTDSYDPNNQKESKVGQIYFQLANPYDVLEYSFKVENTGLKDVTIADVYFDHIDPNNGKWTILSIDDSFKSQLIGQAIKVGETSGEFTFSIQGITPNDLPEFTYDYSSSLVIIYD